MIGCAFRLLRGLDGRPATLLPAPDMVEELDGELVVGAEVVTAPQVDPARVGCEHNGESGLCDGLAEALRRSPVP